MILILSFDDLEETTEDIIDWLIYYNADFVRINGADFIRSIVIKNGNFFYNDLNFDDINVCYFRRFYQYPILDFLKNESISEAYDLCSSLKNEQFKIIQFFWYYLKDKVWFSNPAVELNLNKLTVIEVARKFNLLVPEYLITNKKTDVKDFLKVHESLITKAIGDIGFFTFENFRYNMLTTLIDSSNIDSIPDFFYNSYFQRRIIKEYELRIFYFNEKFYTINIMSQMNKKTEIDSRDYDYLKSNVELPYKLPKTIKNKLVKLFRYFNLTTCSVDFIREAHSNKYFFLEINPIGQFKNVSNSGNFYIEKEIAKDLIKLDNVKR